MRLAFTGTHSTGKTTLANKISKKFNLKLVTNISREIANQHNLKLNKSYNNEFKSNLLQTILMEKHKEILNTNDNIIQDRSMFDVFSYTLSFFDNKQLDMKTLIYNMSILMNNYRKYDLIIHLPLNNNCLLVDDGVRDKNVEFQNEIDGIISSLIKGFDINIYSCTESNWEDRDNEVMDVIEHNLIVRGLI